MQASSPDNSDAYLLTRFRLGTLIKPVSWFQAYTELQDAAASWKNPPLGPPYQSTWDLRRAYVDLGTIEISPVSFRIGRQDLNFGDGRILGTSFWRNASRGYDAAMMVVHWNSVYINAFAASPVVAGLNGLSHHQQGNNLHGIYSTIRSLIPETDLEPYLLWRLSPGIRTEEGALARINEKAAGVRWAGTRSWWDFSTETVFEFGNVGPDQIRAWATVADVGYTFDKHRLRPRLFAEFDFASGDRNPNDGRRGTFDQLYPNIHNHNGLADQVAWQNLKEFRAGARISPRRKWTLAATYNDWWLASATDAFYNSSGGDRRSRSQGTVRHAHWRGVRPGIVLPDQSAAGGRGGHRAHFSGRISLPHRARSRLHVSVRDAQLQLLLSSVEYRATTVREWRAASVPPSGVENTSQPLPGPRQ